MELGLERAKKSKNEPKLDDFPSTQRIKSMQFEHFGI